jgi:hypothetical protein
MLEPLRRLLVIGLAVSAAGCLNFDNGGAPIDVPMDAPPSVVDAGGIDAAAIDAGTGRCALWTENHTHFTPCDIPYPDPTPLVLDMPGVYELDTGTGQLVDPDNQGVPYQGVQLGNSWVMSVESLQIAVGVTFRATGSRSLIIAAWDSITVDGVIDVSSNAAELGAGANPSACSTHAATPGAQDNDGGGGGGGGGFGTPGGPGGDGFNNGLQGAGGNAGNAVTAPAVVRGGCAGADGADADQPGGFGPGGAGGGAVQLTAQNAVTVDGDINAGGQGGDSADGAVGRRAGGGGAGSGGYIGLEAATVDVNAGATLAANGGGGGAGCNNNTGVDGQDAQFDSTSAAGGTCGDGSSGGEGAALDNSMTAAGGDTTARGGGGGGGGVGFIIVRGGAINVNGGATVSPTATQP